MQSEGGKRRRDRLADKGVGDSGKRERKQRKKRRAGQNTQSEHVLSKEFH